jgi:hypothetical protein
MRVPKFIPLPNIPQDLDPKLKAYLQALHSVIKQILEPSGALQDAVDKQISDLDPLTRSHIFDTNRDDHAQYLNITRHDTTTRHPLGSVVPTSATPPPPIGTASGTGVANAVARADHTHAHGDFSGLPGTFHDWNQISNKPTTFPPSAHTHPLSDLQQSGALTNQVPKWTGTAWQAGNVDWTEVINKPETFPPSAHAASHATGGSDALTGNLDANARVGVMNAGTLVGTRRRVNFIAGTNVTLNVTDDATNEKVDVTINAQGGGELFVTATAPPQVINSGSYFVLARITVPTQKPNLKVIAVAVSPFYGYGIPGNARITLYNETDDVVVAIWVSAAGPVYLEPNTTYNLGGKTVSFRLSHGAPGAVECWGSVSFKLTT